MSVKPNYENGSIVNLMSTIAEAVGTTSPYAPLEMGISDFDKVSNILLLVADGIGFNYLQNQGGKTLIRRSLNRSITSVFPPSTGSAVTSFMTGLAPQQHAVTGWYVYLREYGIMSRILPFTTCIDWNVIDTPISDVVETESVFNQIDRSHLILTGHNISNSKFTLNLRGEAKIIGYEGLTDFFQRSQKAVEESLEGCFLYAYWPAYDSISHTFGSGSEEAQEHLLEFDHALELFSEALEGTDTMIIITSDHGFQDVPVENIVHAADHPDLMDCLVLPFGGDTRAAYCYVRPSMTNSFEKYVSEKLDHVCDLHSSATMIREGWFGKFDPNPRLQSRVGDYILTAKEGYCFMNSFPGQERPVFPGHHGGVSEDEMLVPLSLIYC